MDGNGIFSGEHSAVPGWVPGLCLGDCGPLAQLVPQRLSEACVGASGYEHGWSMKRLFVILLVFRYMSEWYGLVREAYGREADAGDILGFGIRDGGSFGDAWSSVRDWCSRGGDMAGPYLCGCLHEAMKDGSWPAGRRTWGVMYDRLVAPVEPFLEDVSEDDALLVLDAVGQGVLPDVLGLTSRDVDGLFRLRVGHDRYVGSCRPGPRREVHPAGTGLVTYVDGWMFYVGDRLVGIDGDEVDLSSEDELAEVLDFVYGENGPLFVGQDAFVELRDGKYRHVVPEVRRKWPGFPLEWAVSTAVDGLRDGPEHMLATMYADGGDFDLLPEPGLPARGFVSLSVRRCMKHLADDVYWIPGVFIRMRPGPPELRYHTDVRKLFAVIAARAERTEAEHGVGARVVHGIDFGTVDRPVSMSYLPVRYCDDRVHRACFEHLMTLGRVVVGRFFDGEGLSFGRVARSAAVVLFYRWFSWAYEADMSAVLSEDRYRSVAYGHLTDRGSLERLRVVTADRIWPFVSPSELFDNFVRENWFRPDISGRFFRLLRRVSGNDSSHPVQAGAWAKDIFGLAGRTGLDGLDMTTMHEVMKCVSKVDLEMLTKCFMYLDDDPCGRPCFSSVMRECMLGVRTGPGSPEDDYYDDEPFDDSYDEW